MPRSETTVMLSTVAVVVVTHNLAIGVVFGVLVAMVLFARRVAHLAHVRRDVVTDEQGVDTAVYTVTGELFFASSATTSTPRSTTPTTPSDVVIDLTASHVWDASTVAALDGITTKYARRGTEVEIRGLNEPSAVMHDRLSGNLSAH